MALRGFTYVLLKTSGQTCQLWDDDMALRGFTVLLKTVQYIGSNVSIVGW